MMIAIIIIFFSYLFSLKNNYNYAYNYYFLSLYQTSAKSLSLPLIKEVESVGGAGYVLSFNERQHIVAFALFEESEVNEMKKKYIGFDTSVLCFSENRLPSRASRLLRVGALCEVFEFFHSEPRKVKEQIDSFMLSASLKRVFTFFERQKEELAVLRENIISVTDGIEENYKSIFLCALDEVESALKNCEDAVYKSERVISRLNYFLIETCLFDIKMRKNFA